MIMESSASSWRVTSVAFILNGALSSGTPIFPKAPNLPRGKVSQGHVCASGGSISQIQVGDISPQDAGSSPFDVQDVQPVDHLHDGTNSEKQKHSLNFFSHEWVIDREQSSLGIYRPSRPRSEDEEHETWGASEDSPTLPLLENQRPQPEAGSTREGFAASGRRHLAASRRAENPIFYPSGGTFDHPIAVSAASSDDSVVYYTLDGTEPSETSASVSSGQVIVVEESGTLRAIATFEGATSTARTSGESRANFTVLSAGKCGHGYFVPHFTSSGYSGKLVEVKLDTKTLENVRLHGVDTDFADFYSRGGIGAYAGQVSVYDLAGDGHDDLVGYRGGFSGKVDGSALGFLSPYFNGERFHGKAVQVYLDNLGDEKMTRFCQEDEGPGPNATCLFKVLNLEEVDPDLRGFSGGFLWDRKAYFVPDHNGRGGGAKFVRVDAGSFSGDSVEVLDLMSVDPELGGFFGGFASDGFGYLVPSRSFQGPVGGVNTGMSADGSASQALLGDSWGRREAGRLKAWYSGKLVRVDLDEFTAAGVQVLDLTRVDPDLRGFSGGFAVGHWGFLVPYKSAEAEDEFSGKMVRFNTLTFDLDGVTVLDLTQASPSLRGFVGGVAHGRYAVLSPYANGNRTSNYRGRSQFGKMVAVDVNEFTPAGVRVLDLAATPRQQIPYQPDPNLRGFVGGFSLGPHVYLTPHFNGVFFGKGRLGGKWGGSEIALYARWTEYFHGVWYKSFLDPAPTILPDDFILLIEKLHVLRLSPPSDWPKKRHNDLWSKPTRV